MYAPYYAVLCQIGGTIRVGRPFSMTGGNSEKGDQRMKRAMLTVLSLVTVLLVLSVSVSAQLPTLQEGDDNLWEYLPYRKVKDDAGNCVKPEMDYSVEPPLDIDLRERCVREDRGNTYVEIFEFGRWTGDF